MTCLQPDHTEEATPTGEIDQRLQCYSAADIALIVGGGQLTGFTVSAGMIKPAAHMMLAIENGENVAEYRYTATPEYQVGTVVQKVFAVLILLGYRGDEIEELMGEVVQNNYVRYNPYLVVSLMNMDPNLTFDEALRLSKSFPYRGRRVSTGWGTMDFDRGPGGPTFEYHIRGMQNWLTDFTTIKVPSGANYDEMKRRLFTPEAHINGLIMESHELDLAISEFQRYASRHRNFFSRAAYDREYGKNASLGELVKRKRHVVALEAIDCLHYAVNYAFVKGFSLADAIETL